MHVWNPGLSTKVCDLQKERPVTLTHGFKVLTDCHLIVLSPQTVAVRFVRPKLVLSDASWNGGWLPECMGVANHQMDSESVHSKAELQEYCRSLLRRHDLDPRTSLQLTTASVVRGGGLSCEQAGGLSVAVVASAGVWHNAVCAGDPASFDEDPNNEFIQIVPGTINVTVFVQAQLEAAVLPRLFTVVAEAKADLLRERQVRSHYSSRIATGTGTDSTIVVSDSHASRRLTTASTHSTLGMAVARAARAAIAAALDNESADAV